MQAEENLYKPAYSRQMRLPDSVCGSCHVAVQQSFLILHLQARSWSVRALMFLNDIIKCIMIHMWQCLDF